MSIMSDELYFELSKVHHESFLQALQGLNVDLYVKTVPVDFKSHHQVILIISPQVSDDMQDSRAAQDSLEKVKVMASERFRLEPKVVVGGDIVASVVAA